MNLPGRVYGFHRFFSELGDWGFTRQLPGTKPAGAKPTPFVEPWIGGHVDLNKMVVPENIEARSGGGIEAFVKAHEGKSKTASAK